MKPVVLVSVVGSALVAAGLFAVNDYFSAGAASRTAVVEQATAAQSAAERTVALQVDNMYCASCPFIVKRALEGTKGVIAADVSFREKRARVTYDSSKTEVAALIRATSEMGYPSRIVGN